MPPSAYRKKPPQKLLDQTEFTGAIRLVTFENEDGSFKVVTFVTDDGEFKASGNLYGAGPGENLRIKGQWFEHPKHGWTFKIDSFLLITPTGLEGIIAYLGSGLIKGVGPKTARLIVDQHGENTIKMMDEMPEMLEHVKGISRRKAREIMESWEKHRASREAMIFLKEHGLTTAMALRLIRHYGDNVVAVLRENPYRAGLEVPLVGFAKADQIAEKMGVDRDSPQRLEAAVVHALERASSEGHTYLPRGALAEETCKLTGCSPEAAGEAIDRAERMQFVIRHERLSDDSPEESAYFIPVLARAEEGCCDMIAELLRQARSVYTKGIDQKIAEFEKEFQFELAPQQQDAIRSAAAGGVVVITGGPGTGKTTLVKALLHLVKQKKNFQFALCSPTGRAAQRLSETTGEEAATIHRLLKWNPQTGNFVHNSENRLPLDMLIVDEASMLDIPLAYSLLRAIPDGASVIFVGDVDQLPSVGPGTFLRDLIESGRVKVARLEVIFRQAKQSLIISNAHRINQGFGIKQEESPRSDFFFVERKEPEDALTALEAMAAERIPKKLKCDPIDGVQVLTPMRRGALGTETLNRILQAKLNPNGNPIPGTPGFRLGDKIIQTSNNYELDVYNGDVGRIENFDSETRLMRVRFGRRRVEYTAESAHDLELAYAITIHKSQGSEYPAVVLVIHSSHYIMLRKNLVYTGVTRGKRLVVIIGSKSALMRAIKNSSENERRSALKTWLLRPPGRGELRFS